MADFAFNDVLEEVGRQAKLAGLDPIVAKSIVTAENTGSGSTTSRKSVSGDAASPAGALGLMQVMPATARGLQQAGFLPPEWAHDPNNLISQVQAGIAAMKEKSGRMNNLSDLGEWASVYNGSSKTHANYKAGKFELLPGETKQYIEKLRRANMELGGQGQNNPSAFVGTAGSTTAPGSNRAGTSSRTTTRSTSYDPAAMDQFMTDVMGAAGAGGSFDQTSQIVADGTIERNLLGQQLQSVIMQHGAAAGEAAQAKAVTEAAGQAKRAEILRAMNLDPAATNNEMAKAFDAVNKSDAALARMRPEIDQRMAVGFFDNPLEWLVNQTRLPGMVAQYNGVVGARKDAVDRFKDISSIATTQQSMSIATEADQILRQGVSAAKMASTDAQAKALSVAHDAVGATTRDAMTLSQLTGQKLSLQAQALSFSKQSNSESFGESERQAAVRAEQQEFDSVNAQIVAAGGSPIQNITMFKQMNSAEKTALVQLASKGKFGKDLASSLEFVDSYGDLNKLAVGGDAAAARWIRGTTDAAGVAVKAEMATAAKLGKKFDYKAAFAQRLGAAQTLYQFEANTDMRTASEFNPHKIDYAGTAQTPEMASNPVAIWLNQYGPKGKTPMMAKVDEEFVVKKFADAVGTGAMTATSATMALTEFYKFATARTAMTNKAVLFGMDKPEKTYQVKLNGFGLSPLSVDLGDPAGVERAFVLKVAYAKATAFYSNQVDSPFSVR